MISRNPANSISQQEYARQNAGSGVHKFPPGPPSPVSKQQIDSTRRQSAPNAALNYQAHIPHPAAAPFPDSRMHSRAYVTCIVPQTSSRTLTGSIPNSKTIPRMVSTIQNPIQARVVTI